MGSCEVVSGRGGLPTVKIVNDAATAEISLMGGHLISYIPKKDSEMIFVSPATRYVKGVPIRGGAPICWPIPRTSTRSRPTRASGTSPTPCGCA